jgi:hypothetical protein
MHEINYLAQHLRMHSKLNPRKDYLLSCTQSLVLA